MPGLIIPERRGLILPPGLRGSGEAAYTRPQAGRLAPPRPWPSRDGLSAAPLTPCGPGTHTGLPTESTESAMLSGGGRPNNLVIVSATGTNRALWSDDDGDTWQTGIAGAANAWQGVCYSPELERYVAVSDSGTQRVMTSDDGGQNWTLRNTPSPAKAWQCVAWSPTLGLFAAASDDTGNSNIMTSPDGENWTLLNIGLQYRLPTIIRWVSQLGRFVVSGTQGGAARLLFSADGVTWATGLAQGNSATGVGMVYSTGLGGFVWSNTAGNIWTSADGLTDPWVLADGSGARNFIALESNSSLAVGGRTASSLFTSPDGATWTSRTNPNTATVSECRYSRARGRFYMCCSSGSSVWRSNDGITWEAISIFSRTYRSITTGEQGS